MIGSDRLSQAGADGIVIRAAQPLEVQTMAVVLGRANAFREGEPLPEKADDLSLFEVCLRMNMQDAWARVAVTAERMAGFALCYPSEQEDSLPPDPDVEYLSLLMVEPDFWGRRIASRLLKVVANEARARGNKQVALWTGEDNNDHAQKVYEHLGYERTDKTRISKYRGKQVQYVRSI